MISARAVLREPLLHFLLLGMMLYGLAAVHARATDPRRIEVTQGVLASLSARYEQQFGVRPGKERMEQLVNDYVADEALYRRGIELGLGAEDEVVRRRVIQKVRFLAEGEAARNPSDETLAAYFRARSDRYATPARTAFRQLYFSPDNGGEAGALDRARTALARLRRGAPISTIADDPFVEGRQFALLDDGQIERAFGLGDFAAEIAAAPLAKWSGPFRSGYGWHVVFVDDRRPSHTPRFEDVRASIRADWLDEEQAQVRERTLAKLLEGFDVVRTDRSSVAMP
ncbi:peptidyl-prolyl cis-trans isomerase [Croceicoccus estronivorus]|uniref:peptidylprolyl isomerase n=1 Tax=Croceicoccus estronivorus TaxID=1172626 RepID=UPI000ABA1CCD|nr:peptidylprolyl isomerase [Croceicoccus estronivorus]